MAKPELGVKRQCQNCGAKFFDMNRDPILCPRCATVFVVTHRVAIKPEAAVAADEPEVEIAPVELVALEEAEPAEKVAAVADDVEIEDDAPADDTFLEEEEEGEDDVTGLIDGELETDEET